MKTLTFRASLWAADWNVTNIPENILSMDGLPVGPASKTVGFCGGMPVMLAWCD